MSPHKQLAVPPSVGDLFLKTASNVFLELLTFSDLLQTIMAKVIEVYQDVAGEYRWRKIRGKQIVSVMGEGDPLKQKVVKAAKKEDEDGAFEVRDLTVDTNLEPEPVDNPDGADAETVPVPADEELPPSA